jgi:acetolactate synthase-1/2/3 large subunit
MINMTVSEYIVDFLVAQNTKKVFLVTGGAIANVVDALGRRRDAKGDIGYVCVQHEQAGAMAVEAYSKLASGLGVAMATSGPGATNFITGICGLWFDSIPGLFITGQVGAGDSYASVPTKPRQVGFQETDIVSIVKPITKYAVNITDPKQIRYELEKAVWFARAGRPGPSLVDIPVNIQVAQIDPNELIGFTPDSTLDENVASQDGDVVLAEKATQIAKLITDAKRPLILLGGGIRLAGGASMVSDFVEKLGVPVIVSWSGFDLLPSSHKLRVGELGVYGNRGANFAVQNCDLLVTIGSRLDTRQTGGSLKNFARAAKKVMIDIDHNELGKNRGIVIDLAVHADAVRFMKALLATRVRITSTDIPEWRKATAKWRSEYPAVLPQYLKQKKLSAYICADAISTAAKAGDTVIIDEGGNLVWSMQSWKVKSGQRIISTFGNSPMGYALPAAVGAAVAQPKKNIICIDGDGGFQLNIQELQTLVHYKLSVKIFLLNNQSMGIIKQFQNLAFGSRRYAVDAASGYSAPDFVKVAKAYGIPAVRIVSSKNIKKQVAQVLARKGPVICDMRIDVNQELNPKLEYGKPLEDMYPYMTDEDLSKNMLIEQLPREERKKGWLTIKN